jgi:hypothetical protein
MIPKHMRALAFAKIIGALFASYVLAYLMLSFCGQYQSESAGGLGHWDEFAVWAPLGFYDSRHSPPGTLAAKRGIIIGTWRRNVVICFLPLWGADIRFVHRTKYLRSNYRNTEGKWITTTNNVPAEW